MIACSNNTTQTDSSAVNDTTSNNPVTDATDHHPDQRQEIPISDSSNVIGTDTINGSVATPNTGTNKSYNTQKGDSTHK